MGLLARFFKGGFSIPAQSVMKWRDIKPWYDIYMLQSTEEEIVNELSYDDKGNKRTLPSNERIRELVLKRIAEKKGEITDGVKVLD